MLQKDKNRGNVASNYRPIICLPLMWQLLAGVIADICTFRSGKVVIRRTEKVEERF